MKALILLTACFLGTKLADSVPVNLKSIQPRVVGGMPAELRQFPYHVLITNVRISGSINFCGGAVISNSWVLTFASCTNNIENITLLFGATNRYNTSEEGQVSQSISGLDSEKYVIRHPNRFDLALIRLPQKLILNEYIQAVKLPSDYPFQTFVNSPAVVSGYGRAFNAGDRYETLQYGYGNIMDLNECSRIIKTYPKERKICIDNGISGVEACEGDNGNPLVSTVTGELIGIGALLSSKGCGAGYPSEFSSIVYYRDWIKDNSGV